MMKFIYENEFGGSIEFSKDSSYRLLAIQGLSENTIDVYEASSVNQIGATLTGAKIKAKNIIFTGDFPFTSEKRKKLINVIVPGKKGKLRYMNDGLDVYLDVTPVGSPMIDHGQVYQGFQFELRASYPYWRERISTTYDFSSIVSFFRLPRSFSSTVPWKISRATKNIILNVENDSTQETGFTLTLEAITDVRCPELLNVETQQHIKMADDFILKAGEKIVITTYENNKRCTLIRNGVELPAFRYLSDDTSLFNLKPGDNIIRYGAGENYEGLRARIEFSRTLAGV